MSSERQGRKPLKHALLDLRLAPAPIGELAFWSETVIAKRADRDQVCAALDKILREHPEWAPLEERES